jgi:biotin operon repressor
MSVAAARPFALITLVLFSGLSGAQTTPRTLITKPVDENQLTVLKGNTHPLARAEFDRGAAPADLPMNRMLLVLKRSDEQESALRSLIDNQQDKASPNYHKWLSPEQFGKQFGPSDQDIAQVTSWLQSHGFQIAQVSKGRTVIEFSGTAAQVQEALRTSIHKYAVNGEEHWANSTDPQIPAALTPVVAGVLTLHNFLKKPQIHLSNEQISAKYVPGARPQFTSSSGRHALTPADYDVIYNITPQSVGGGPASIAIVGRTNINFQDIYTFHNLMNDGAVPPQFLLNGADPGDLGGGEEAEAVLDTTWSGAVAPSAAVTLVVSASTNSTDGVDLSEIYIVDNNLADVMSESFGGCEAGQTNGDASAISSLAQQAAAEGITYMVSTGDSGAAGCDDPNSETSATGPFSVNILASTPYTVAIGGTMFNENGQDSTYWNTTNSSSLESALSYIPEKVWNESCIGTSCGSAQPNIWSGSGGASTFFQKPSWQAGFGDASRDLPDVSLTAAGHDPYLLCLDNSCAPDSQGLFHFAGIAGTSASAPSFAGIMARVAQKTGSRQGQADYVLYKLAAAETFSQCNGSKPGGLQVNTCVFNDVTVGNNSVPGDADYGTASAKYQSSSGYDLATGLGSVNVTNLLNAWNTATFNATSTTASISPIAIVHGAAINVNVQVTANSGKPSGPVWLQGGNQKGNLIGDNTEAVLTLDSTGSVSTTTHVLPGGNYAVSAHYVGDGTYAPSDSAPTAVSIQAEPSVVALSLLTTDQAGNFVPYSGGQYGIPVYIKAHVAGQSGYGVPTSVVDFSDKSQFIYYVYLDRNGDAVLPAGADFTAGPHSATAQYQGDGSFQIASSAAASFVVTQAATTISATAKPAAPQGAYLTAIVTTTSSGQPPSGSVTFYSGNTSLGTAAFSPSYVLSQNGTIQESVSLTDQQLINGQYSITAVYTGDNNYSVSKSAPVNVTLQPDFSVDPSGSDTNTITRGQSAIFQFTVNFNDGFTGTVNLSCSGLPSESSCTTQPATITASGTDATLSIGTKAPVTATLKATGSSRSTVWAAILGPNFVGIFLLSVPSRKRRLSALVPLLMAAFLVAGIACGGGGSSPSVIAAAPQADPGTPRGTYTITVTGTSGTVSHNLTYTLTIQ